MNASKVIALIPSAGSGSRLGLSKPKALVEVSGKTIIERTLEVFAKVNQIAEILVMAPQEHLVDFAVAIKTSNKPISVVAGGETRQNSVYNGLCFLRDNNKVTPETRILVHDAARCLIVPDIVRQVIKQSEKKSAISCAIPVVDTLVAASADTTIKNIVSRENVWAIQTPQIFAFQLLMDAHEKAKLAGRNDYTDDTSILEGASTIDIEMGARENIKITTPEDPRLAEILTRSRKGNKD